MKKTIYPDSINYTAQVIRPKCTILVGMPCSGKTTWMYQNYSIDTRIISANILRAWDKPGYNPSREKQIWELFYHQFENAVASGKNIIVDNTNCRIVYIAKLWEILNSYKLHEIEIRYFEIFFIKAMWRNIVRAHTVDKWIPIKVIWRMYKNFNSINREEYAKYLVYK